MPTLLPKASILLFFFFFFYTCTILVYAQFNFFEQMFGGGGGHAEHHRPKDVPSDSAWYRKQWQDGKPLPPHRAQCYELQIS